MSDLDIEAYIAAQKEKLIRERQLIQNAPVQQKRLDPDYSSRKRWEPAQNPDQYLPPTDKTSPGKREPDSTENGVLPLGGYEQRRLQLNAERKREYNEQLVKNGLPPSVPKENIPPRRRPETPQEQGLLGGKLGDYEQKRKKLDDERKDEYNKLLAQKNFRSGRRDDSAQAYVPTIPGLQKSDSAEIRKAKSRNAEYNEFLRQKQEKEKHRFDDKKGLDHPEPVPQQPQPAVTESEFASLRVRDVDSAQVRKRRERERNDEYNEFLKYKEAQKRKNRGRDDFISDDEQIRSKPRTGWATPTYEEILDKKRQEERQYRQRNDPEYHQPMKLGGANYLRSSVSDGFLNEDKHLRDLDREFERKKVQFDREIDVRVKEEEFNHWNGQPLQGRDKTSPPDISPSRPRRNIQPDLSDGEYYATLPVGYEDTSSAKLRRKEQYRKDLEAQMAELASTKRMEKIRDLSDGRGSTQTAQAPPAASRSAPTPGAGPAPPVDPSRSYYNPAYPPTAATAAVHDGPRGILNRGFDFPYGRQPPGAPQSQANLLPNSLVNGAPPSGIPPLDLYRNPLDEAYYYYATRNPLEPELAGGQTIPSNYGAPSAVRQDVDASRSRSKSRVNFDDSPRRAPTRNLNEFPSEAQQRSRSRSEKELYQAELQRQIEERKKAKMIEKQKQEEYDRKKEDEIANYNPYGRGGGGAPIKDRGGNIKADLRTLRRENEDPETPRKRLEESRQQPYLSPRGYDTPAPPTVKEEEGFARKGNGFFGEPQSTEEKSASEKYKEELQKQIEEKKRKKAEEDAKVKAEEEKELKRIEEEQRRMKEEYEAEQKRQREKEEEEQRKNEEIKRQAEEKRQEAERQRKEAEEKRLEEIRKRQDEESLARQRQQEAQRQKSPPIPTMRSKTVAPTEARTDSPPVPAARSKTEPDSVSLRGRTSPPVPAVNSQSKSDYRANSADVLNQLARMRQQLQSERLRVESALRKKKDDVEVYDPRLSKAPIIQAPIIGSTRPERVNSHNAAEFNKLKHRGSPSRQEFRSMYPESPSTNSQLERQQRALLKQQQDNLFSLQQGSDDPIDGRTSPSSRLQAETAYIELESGIKRFPNDFDDLPKHRKNEPARQRRREKRRDTPVSVASDDDSTPPSKPTPRNNGSDVLGSSLSLDADKITQKNQDRLRRLRTLAGDETSLADPDEVLNRFMAKQDFNRPPSGQTLQDDTWLRPDSRY